MNTRLFLCHVHFLYNAVKKAKALQLESSSYYLFIFGFTLLQNATSIEEFNEILKLLHTIFKQEYCESEIIERCISTIKAKVAYRNIDVLKLLSKYDSTYEQNCKEKINIQTVFISDDFHGNLKLNSCLT